MRSVGLRRVVLSDVAMRRVFMDPVNIALGNQALDNYNFNNMTIGSEDVIGGDFSNAGDWDTQAPWTVASGVATMDYSLGDGNLSQQVASLTAYQSYQVQIDLVSEDGDGQIELRSNTWGGNVRIDNAGIGTQTYYLCNYGSAPTNYAMRGKNGTVLTGVLDNASAKPITLDSWTELGTRTAAEWMIFDDAAKTTQIVSGGLTMGVSIPINDFAAGDYYYSVDIVNDALGTLKISTAGDGDLATIDNTGEHTGVISLTDGTIRLEANGACDLTVCCFELYPVL